MSAVVLTAPPRAFYKPGAMKIFLSHASESKALVRRLTEPLPPHVSIWLDRDMMATGHRFGPRIDAAIQQQCDFVLVFVDGHALASEWVRHETALALRRQVDLQRTYLLPVLIEAVGARMTALGIDPAQMLYLDATDTSDAGIATSAQRLGDELFMHCSLLVETLRDADRRRLLDELGDDITEFKQVAFMWQASMGHGMAVLAGNQAAFDHVRDSLADYNRVANRVIPRLTHHRDRITAAWRDRRSLCEDVRHLLASIDADVYRVAMFRLNQTLEAIQQLVGPGRELPGSDELARLDAEKDRLNDAARQALERMTTAAADVIGDLERELDI